MTATLPPRGILGGRYRVEQPLGRGGMGMVVEATEVSSSRRCAVKVLRSRFIDSAAVVERFRREARILDAIEHPAIVRIHDCGETHDGVFIAMELLHGETLLERLRREGTLSPAVLVPIVDALCDALAAVHAAGVIHRDLKPANVFLVEGGEAPVKLIDFGVAKVLELQRLTLTGQVVGTVSYMAPEQITGKPVDIRADIYAIGVILHGALHGRPSFPRETHLAMRAIIEGAAPPLTGVPAPVAAVIAKAMAIEPRERHSSAKKLARAFREAVAASGDAAHAAPPASQACEHGPSTAPTEVASMREGSAPPTEPLPLVRLRARFPSRVIAIGGALAAIIVAFAFTRFAIGACGDDAEAPAPSDAVLVPTAPATEQVMLPVTPTEPDASIAEVPGDPPDAAPAETARAPKPRRPVVRQSMRSASMRSAAMRSSSNVGDIVDPWGP